MVCRKSSARISSHWEKTKSVCGGWEEAGWCVGGGRRQAGGGITQWCTWWMTLWMWCTSHFLGEDWFILKTIKVPQNRKIPRGKWSTALQKQSWKAAHSAGHIGMSINLPSTCGHINPCFLKETYWCSVLICLWDALYQGTWQLFCLDWIYAGCKAVQLTVNGVCGLPRE